jgi:hypothetical protein
MDTKRKAIARMAVTELLRRFFGDLTTRLAAGTADFWSKVEQRLPIKSPDMESELTAPPGVLRMSMQQQPMQQQQAKAELPDNNEATSKNDR